MNIVKKVYCRVFQTAFRIAIPVLPYRNPKILHKTKDIPAIMAAVGLKRPLLVTDEAIRGLGLTKELAKRMIQEIYALNEKLGIPRKLEGIREEDIDSLAAYAEKEANPLYPVPVLWDREQLKEVYRRVM